METTPQDKKKIVSEIVVNLVSAIGFFVIFYCFIAQTHEVHGASMQPTFFTGDRVITEKVTKRFHGILRGDIVVLQTVNQAEPLIKRVIALPDETIVINDGHISVDGKILMENYIDELVKTAGQRFLQEGVPYTLASNEYIVMGDNRNVSSDSRSWGTVKENEIIGKVIFRYWPLNRIGLLYH